MKSIKRALSLCGHSIVGDGGAVKSAKGIFASVVSVTIYDPNYNEYDQINNELNSEYNLKSDQNSTDLNQINSEKSNENSNEKVTDNKLNRFNKINKINKKIMPFTICIPDPLKFEKLMKKEEELWIRAEKKDLLLIETWNLLNEENKLKNTENNGDIKSSANQNSDENGQKKEDVDEIIKINHTDKMMQNLQIKNEDDGMKIVNEYENANQNKETMDRENSNETVVMNNNGLKPSPLSRFSTLTNMRQAVTSGMPVEYVLGQGMFFGIEFNVDENVMVPRKASEILINGALENVFDGTNFNFFYFNSDKLSKINGHDEVENQGSGEFLKNIDVKNVENENENGGKEVEKEVVLRVLDIGTGSGCLLLSYINQCNLNASKNKSEKQKQQQQQQQQQTNAIDKNVIENNFTNTRKFDQIRVFGTGVDISPEALNVAKKNSKKLGLEDQTFFSILDFKNLKDLVPNICQPEGEGDGEGEGETLDLTNSVENTSENENKTEYENNKNKNEIKNGFKIQDPIFSEGPYNIILCNPPYSSKRDRSRLSIACREHEPSLALYAPEGPLGSYRVLAVSMKEAEEKYENNRNYQKNQYEIKVVSEMNAVHTDGRDNNEGDQSGSGSGDSVDADVSTVYGLFAQDAFLFLEVGHGLHTSVIKIFSTLPFLVFIKCLKDEKDIDRCLVFRYVGGSQERNIEQKKWDEKKLFKRVEEEIKGQEEKNG